MDNIRQLFFSMTGFDFPPDCNPECMKIIICSQGGGSNAAAIAGMSSRLSAAGALEVTTSLMYQVCKTLYDNLGVYISGIPKVEDGKGLVDYCLYFVRCMVMVAEQATCGHDTTTKTQIIAALDAGEDQTRGIRDDALAKIGYKAA